MDEQMFTGQVRSYSEHGGKKFGFITCPALGCDVYFQQRDLPLNVQGIDINGQQVSFVTHVTADGKIQGRKLQFCSMGGGCGGMRQMAPMGGMNPMGGMGMNPMGMMNMGYMGMNPMMQQSFGGMHPQQRMMQFGGMPQQGMMQQFGGAGGRSGPSQGAEGSSMTGSVKNYDVNKGYGFLNSPGFPADIYFKSQEPLQQGQQVAFTLRYTKDGKPQANNLSPCMQGGEVLVGMIRSYNDQKGYGFISAQDSPQDVYFKKSDLPSDFQEMHGSSVTGCQVQCTVKVTQDGKPQAQDLQILSQGGVKREADDESGMPSAKRQRLNDTSGERHMGEVKMFNPAKGFGFLSSPTVATDVYFKDAMLPPQMQGLEVPRGAQVTFTLNFAANGKAQASELEFAE